MKLSPHFEQALEEELHQAYLKGKEEGRREEIKKQKAGYTFTLRKKENYIESPDNY